MLTTTDSFTIQFPVFTSAYLWRYPKPLLLKQSLPFGLALVTTYLIDHLIRASKRVTSFLYTIFLDLESCYSPSCVNSSGSQIRVSQYIRNHLYYDDSNTSFFSYSYQGCTHLAPVTNIYQMLILGRDCPS